jgi:formylglycine-generating enzyme required for sulfatase activity
MRKTFCALGALTFFTATMIVGTAAGDEKKPAAPRGTPRAFERYVEKIPGTVVQFEMVPIPAGSLEYKIGKGEPRKAAVKRFWIGKTEVTHDELDVFRLGLDLPEAGRAMELENLIAARTRPSKPQGDPSWGFGHGGFPALSMTYHHAAKYSEWLSEKTGRKYRLPTEVEWEYACRAGGPAEGFTEEQLDKIAWWRGNSNTEEHIDGKTHPVGTKAPNAWGVHDMLGNAWEWCTDVDGKPVARGGAYDKAGNSIQPSARFNKFEFWFVTQPQEPRSTWWYTDGKSIGFRVVCEE